MAEHEELLRRTGETAPAMLERLGSSAPTSSWAIASFSITIPGRDNARGTISSGWLASETSVAHCPYFCAQRHDAGKPRRLSPRRCQCGIGTDSYPFNMLEEMREAMICSRVTGKCIRPRYGGNFQRRHHRRRAGARRDDIGRFKSARKADLALVDLSQPAMQPVTIPSAISFTAPPSGQSAMSSWTEMP